jgi:hypothetical protein
MCFKLKVTGVPVKAQVLITAMLSRRAADRRGASPASPIPAADSTAAAALSPVTVDKTQTGSNGVLEATLSFADAGTDAREIAVYADTTSADGMMRIVLVERGVMPPPEYRDRQPLGVIVVRDGYTLTANLDVA